MTFGDQKAKLELTWIGKENRPRLEPRILLEDPERSYHAPYRVTNKDIFDNRVILGRRPAGLRPYRLMAQGGKKAEKN